MNSSSHSTSASSGQGAEERDYVPLHRMTGISKSFAGVPALVDVDLDLQAAKVHALLGQNGAGKSTLISIMSGVHQPDSGELEIDGVPVVFSSPSDALNGGVVAVYQELSLLPDMTVAQNLALGLEPQRVGVLDLPAMRRRAREVLDVLGAGDIDPSSLVGDLSIANQQLVEIAKALVREARVVILDEPSAVLGNEELSLLYAMVRRLTDNGIAVVYITHRLDEVMEIADEVCVMRDGRKVIDQPRQDTTQQDMITAMVGREVLLDAPPKWRSGESVPGEGPVLSVSGVSMPGMGSYTLDFTLRPGEILGIAGLTGSGRSRILRMLAGLQQPSSGAVRLGERSVRLRSPRSAIAQGIVLVPEDRKRLGLVLNQSVLSNATLSILKRLAILGWLRGALLRRRTNELIERLSIKTAGSGQEVRLLSGGNQQKVVLARCISTRPSVLLLDEPLRGVDIGAKAEIIDIVGEVAAQGTAVIVVSSEIEDVLALTDRILVIRDGVPVGELLGTDATESNVLALSSARSA